MDMPPLAYGGSLLTSNYCSSCYFWADEGCRMSRESSPMLPSHFPCFGNEEELYDYRKHCVFAKLPIRVVKFIDSWPDGHRHFPVSAYLGKGFQLF